MKRVRSQRLFGLVVMAAALASASHAFPQRRNLVNAPEIDPGLLTGTIAFVTGGALLLTDRVRRRR
ncbi:MAG: hypothetical protein IPJ77_05580 [Planctomycetes bacterium]|nr:hypothetical protein [Planctomycetota bacterium]